jgi:hypothetical protein
LGPSGNHPEELWTAKPDGTGAAQVSHQPYGPYPDCTSTEGPSWTPDATRIVFDADCDPAGYFRLILINRDGTAQQVVGEPVALRAAWSPGGRKIVYDWYEPPHQVRVANSDFTNPVSIRSPGFDPDWQPIPYTGYPRPNGATPLRVSLVPAFKECTAPNRSHGPPLVSGSCNRPVQTSNYLTVGTADATGASANSIGFILFRVRATSPEDLLITATITDVRCRAATSPSVCSTANATDGPDYSGQIQANATIRISDHYNGSNLNEPATVTDLPFPVNGQCIDTNGESGQPIGGTCTINTSANAVQPGMFAEGPVRQRAVVEFGQVKVYDGGLDG